MRIIVLEHEGKADDYQDGPCAAAEVVANADEQADHDEEGMPTEKPVGQGETHLVHEEDAADDEQEKTCPDTFGGAAVAHAAMDAFLDVVGKGGVAGLAGRRGVG